MKTLFSRMRMRAALPYLMTSLIVASCQNNCRKGRSELAPDQVVEAYLDTAFNMSAVTQKQDLMQYTTGNLRAAISGASDEVIQKAYIDRRYRLTSYAVMERKDRTPRETEITFQLKYKDLGDDGDVNKAPLVTTDNTVAVVKEKGVWYIRDVLGKKTSFDFPLAAAIEIKAKPGVVSPEPTPLPEDQDEPPLQP